MASNPKYPTFDHAVEIIEKLITNSAVVGQLQFVERTQGREFAERVKAKWLESKKGKAK